MTGPQDPARVGAGRLRAGHADREQVIEALKDAFVHGRLTKDELDARAGQALAAQTYADLAALTVDIPPAPAAPPTAGLARPPAPARRRPLARAAAKSGGCLVFAYAAGLFAGTVLDPNGPGPHPYHSWAPLALLVALSAVLAAVGFLVQGVITSVEQRRSRRQLPPRPGPGRHALHGERHGSAGHDTGPPGPRTDQARADLRSDSSRPRRPHSPGRGARTPRGLRPVPDAG
jgi:hypothetical protein